MCLIEIEEFMALLSIMISPGHKLRHYDAEEGCPKQDDTEKRDNNERDCPKG